MNNVVCRKIGFVFILFVFVVNTLAQNVTVESKIDSLEMLIGSQTKLTIETTCDVGAKVTFPIFNDTIVDGLEIIEKLGADTSFINEGKRMTISNGYIVSSFDSAFFYIPGFDISVDGEYYKSNDLALKVYLMPIDTPDIKTVKTILSPKFVFSDWVGLFSSIIIFAVIIILFIYLIKRIRDNKPIIRKIHIEPERLPHEHAEFLLNDIIAKKLASSENVKMFYTELTDVLRSYISARYNFNAKEMTSSEILEKLHDVIDKEDIQKLKNFFSLSDLVKFAKYRPFLNENDANILLVTEFINKTKIEIPIEQREKPLDIIIEEPRSRRAKILLISTSFVLFVILIILSIYIYLELDDMLL